jgi:hypothetical protein
MSEAKLSTKSNEDNGFAYAMEHLILGASS